MKTIHQRGARSVLATLIVAVALTPALIPWRAIAQKNEPVPTTPPTATEHRDDGRDHPESAPFINNTSEEEKLLNSEIAIARKDLEAVSRAKEYGKALPEDVIAKNREVQKLERELAALRHDPVKIRESLKAEIADVEKLQVWMVKRLEVGAASPEDKSKIDRELLRLKRELAALDREQPNAEGPQSMMYYMSNPELMKRYFPQMYAMMTNKGARLGTNVDSAIAQTNITAQDTFQNRLDQAYRDGGRPRIRLQPRRPGVVTFVNVKRGEHVETGHVLVRLDDREAQIKLRGAQSEYEIAQADHALKKKAALSNLDVTLSQITRNKPVNADDVKKSYQEEYDLKVKKLDSELRLASIKVEQAQLEVDERILTAPVDGIVGNILAMPGQSLSESSVAVVLELGASGR